MRDARVIFLLTTDRRRTARAPGRQLDEEERDDPPDWGKMKVHKSFICNSLQIC